MIGRIITAVTSRLGLAARLARLQPSTILSVAVALALVTTTGGALVARFTGIWPGSTQASTVVATDDLSSVPSSLPEPSATLSVPPLLVPPVLPTSGGPDPVVSAAPAAPVSAPAPPSVEPTTPASTGPTSAPRPSGRPTPAAAATPAVPSSTAPTSTPPTPGAPACPSRSGYDLSLCGQGRQLAAADSTGALPCATTSTEARCGEAGSGYAVAARMSGGQLLVRYSPAFVACLPDASAAVGRFDCLRLGGGGETAPRPDNAFLELWADGTAVSGRMVPRGCVVSSSFSCDGVSVALGSTTLSVEYAASSAITCAGFSDQTVGAVMVRCGYR